MNCPNPNCLCRMVDPRTHEVSCTATYRGSLNHTCATVRAEAEAALAAQNGSVDK